MATIGEKVEHVRAAAGSDTGGHHCHWPNCPNAVPPAMWGCKTHWFTLPRVLRTKIWNAYRPGQEQSKDPSRVYLEVVREAQEWIKGFLQHFPDPVKRKPQQGSLSL